jgi:2-polyprenyl-6-methoxyphenol hydroxylase-like FAD-dependent oxidoreductase
MNLPAHASVLIVGAGPVGLAAAVELGTRGVDCVVLEPRIEVSPLRPRAKTTSVRTMEHFRRWGIADRIRAAAPVPVSWSQSVMAATSLTGSELTRFDDCLGLSTGSVEAYAEASQQIPQPAVEQVLRDVAGELDDVTLALGWSMRSLTEGDGEVVVEAVDGDGTVRRITTQYVLACDGGGSTTRKSLGISMAGPTQSQDYTTVVFRSPELAQHVPHRPAVQYLVFNPRAIAVFGRLDLADTWWAGMVLPPDVDPSVRLREVIGPEAPEDLKYEILCADNWRVRMLLAETFGTGRVFLAGDAAHLNPPTGGHGYNTGVGDAVNIGWKLAATLQGWGGPRLLESYNAERRAIAIDTITAATTSLLATLGIGVPAEADLPGPEGDRARSALGEQIHSAMRAEFNSLGLVLGYEYADSPVIAYDDESAGEAEKDTTVYVPATRPGARLPHRWLTDGRSLYDDLGTGLTLITFGDHDPGAMTDAARARGVVLTHIDLGSECLVPGDRTSLLVRPDQHIAWRGGQLSPQSADAVLSRVLGGSAGDAS